MKLRKRFKTGAMLCNAIASFVAHFTDSNVNDFLVVKNHCITSSYLWYTPYHSIQSYTYLSIAAIDISYFYHSWGLFVLPCSTIVYSQISQQQDSEKQQCSRHQPEQIEWNTFPVPVNTGTFINY